MVKKVFFYFNFQKLDGSVTLCGRLVSIEREF